MAPSFFLSAISYIILFYAQILHIWMKLMLLLRFWTFDYVDLFSIYELIGLRLRFFLSIFCKALCRLSSFQHLILDKFSILISIANYLNTLHVFILVGSSVLAEPLVIKTGVKASFTLAQSLDVGLAALLAVLAGVHALLISNKSTVHVSLILWGFLNAVLRDGAHTQSTHLAVSAVIELTFVIQKVIWHFDAFAWHPLQDLIAVISSIIIVVDIFDTLFFSLLHGVNPLAAAPALMRWDPLYS